jgi:hypothetical protein
LIWIKVAFAEIYKR